MPRPVARVETSFRVMGNAHLADPPPPPPRGPHRRGVAGILPARNDTSARSQRRENVSGKPVAVFWKKGAQNETANGRTVRSDRSIDPRLRQEMIY